MSLLLFQQPFRLPPLLLLHLAYRVQLRRSAQLTRQLQYQPNYRPVSLHTCQQIFRRQHPQGPQLLLQQRFHPRFHHLYLHLSQLQLLPLSHLHLQRMCLMPRQQCYLLPSLHHILPLFRPPHQALSRPSYLHRFPQIFRLPLRLLLPLQLLPPCLLVVLRRCLHRLQRPPLLQCLQASRQVCLPAFPRQLQRHNLARCHHLCHRLLLQHFLPLCHRLFQQLLQLPSHLRIPQQFLLPCLQIVLHQHLLRFQLRHHRRCPQVYRRIYLPSLLHQILQVSQVFSRHQDQLLFPPHYLRFTLPIILRLSHQWFPLFILLGPLPQLLPHILLQVSFRFGFDSCHNMTCLYLGPTAFPSAGEHSDSLFSKCFYLCFSSSPAPSVASATGTSSSLSP